MVNTVRMVWPLLAVSLGLTCLAVYNFPWDRGSSYRRFFLRDTSTTAGIPTRVLNGTTLLYQFNSSPPAPSYEGQHVKWIRHGNPIKRKPCPLQSEKDSYNSAHKNQQPLLETVPHSFQEQLLSGLPLLCYPGPEGLFRPRYDRFLRTLLDYADNHGKMRSSPSSRILTWQCITQEHCGGLGDRIRGVTYALLLAMLSYRRLVVFWEDSLEGAYLDPHMINWRDDRVYDILRGSVKTDSQVQHIWIKSVADRMLAHHINRSQTEYDLGLIGSNFTHIVVSTNLRPSKLIDPERSGNQEWVKSGLIWSGLSHLSPSELDAVVGVVFRYLFRLKDGVLEEMQVARRVLGLCSPYAALHLRTGFAGMDQYLELKHPQKLEKSVTEWHINLYCGVEVANRFLGNNSPIFLATDSKLVKDIAVAKYGQRIRTLGNSLIHVDQLDNVKVDAKVKEGVLVMWVEFLLLAQSKVLIKGASGYSRAAGLISGMDGNRTVSTNNCIK